MWTRGIGAGLGAMLTLCLVEDAWACGCVVTTDVVTPTVQAGERIVFGVKDGKVTAHIQIQYQGAAEEFAWLVPVPAVPEVQVGTDELFTILEAETSPTYTLTTVTPLCGSGGGGGGGGFGCSGSDDSALLARADSGGATKVSQTPDVLVLASSAGPYDYAVLRADDRREMLDWLNTNAYVVPGGTEAAVAPYIRPGAYFLALKLKAGESSGSIRPIILEYESDFPMIPLVLTSVAAIPDMGILVWIFGEHRAVPRNFHHVVIDEATLDWSAKGVGYAAVLSASIDQAPNHHAFVTEFAGRADQLNGRLRLPFQDEDRANLLAQSNRDVFLQMLRRRGDWPTVAPILLEFYPYPAELAARGVSPADYLAKLDEFVAETTETVSFDPEPIVDRIWATLVTPLVEANQLFTQHQTVTRLYTVLSPEEMTADPVFAFNADLPHVPRAREATLNRDCAGGEQLLLSDGRVIERRQSLVRARVEILREEGQPEVLQENVTENAPQEGGGCAHTSFAGAQTLRAPLLLGSLLLLRRRGRRDRR